MLLVIDVGNTNTVMGVYDGNHLVRHWRLGTARQRSADEYGVLVQQLLGMAGLTLAKVEAAVLSCVVPPVEWVIVHMLEDYCRIQPLVVGPGIKTGLKIRYDNPKEVGADRIVNAVAALDKYPGPMIVVDFGTATTFDAIDADGAYLGGAIAPGINISMEALFRQASKLPRVPFARPEAVIGRTTVQAIQSGLFYGYVGLVDEIISRTTQELSGEVRVLATGGLGKLIGAGRRDGSPLPLLHARAGRRDHRLRDPGTRCVGPPGRLLEHRGAPLGPDRPPDRGRVGRRTGRNVRRSHRGQGHRPVAPAQRRDREARRAADQHPELHVAHGRDRMAKLRFEFELADPEHLSGAIATVRNIESVYDVERVSG